MRHTFLLLVTVSLFCQAQAGTPDAAEAAKQIKAEHILQSVKTLSADDMEGRATGTAGEKKAAAWIAARYKEYGLESFGGDYALPVELVGYKKDAAASSLNLHTAEGPLTLGEGMITYWSTAQKAMLTLKDAPLLFVGYGVEAPEHQWDDFKGVDCKGKILVFLNNDPQTGVASEFGGAFRTYYGRYTYKFEQAVRHGAAGAIMIHTTPSAGYGWSVVGDNGEHESFALKIPGTGYQLDFLAWMHQDLAERLAASVGTTLAAWEKQATDRAFKPVSLPIALDCSLKTEIREVHSQNVAGIWRGADPQLRDEYLVFTAHYDHLGLAEHGEGDRVFNGAWDNGLGTSCIVEMAAAFSRSGLRPKRSLVFLACTGEEKGLLGSQYFVAKPPVPLSQIVGNFNIDMPQIFGLTSDIVAIGHDSNSMGAALSQLASDAGITLVGDQNPNAGSFYRSDQVSFAKAGIPALYLLPGKQYTVGPTTDPGAYHERHYHQLADEINEHWNLVGCERDMRLLFQLASRIADAADAPRWRPGNEFENAWKKLHGQP